MVKNKYFIKVHYCSWFFMSVSLVQAIPLTPTADFSDQLWNTTLQIFNESSVCIYQDITYPSGKNFTGNNPCETCVCEPPKYTCTIQNCDLKPGCKAIQKSDACCPEYVCGCENNGKTYENGEKVEELNPCKVCYCSGGQIKCNFVTCYFRDDCKPVYVKGRCCPKYDDCPPLDVKENRTKITELTVIEKIQIPDEVVPPVENSGKFSGSVATLEVIEIHQTEPGPAEKQSP